MVVARTGWAGKVSLAVAIMHAPWDAQRRAWTTQLCQRLRPLPVEVIHARPNGNIWLTARSGWQWLARQPTTHSLLLQDDVKLCDDFVAALAAAICARPTHVISPFTMRRKEVEATRAGGGAWYTARQGIYGQAVVLPRAWIAPMLRWSDHYTRRDYIHDDARLNLWTTLHGINVWQTVPCLLQHAGARASLVGHGGGKRDAIYVADGEVPDFGNTQPVLHVGQTMNTRHEWELARRDPAMPFEAGDDGWRPASA